MTYAITSSGNPFMASAMVFLAASLRESSTSFCMLVADRPPVPPPLDLPLASLRGRRTPGVGGSTQPPSCEDSVPLYVRGVSDGLNISS